MKGEGVRRGTSDRSRITSKGSRVISCTIASHIESSTRRRRSVAYLVQSISRQEAHQLLACDVTVKMCLSLRGNPPLLLCWCRVELSNRLSIASSCCCWRFVAAAETVLANSCCRYTTSSREESDGQVWCRDFSAKSWVERAKKGNLTSINSASCQLLGLLAD